MIFLKEIVSQKVNSFSLALLFAVLFVANNASRADEGVFRVSKVVDGDTIHIISSSQELFKVRLHGIDTPERGQPYFRVATSALKDLVAAKNVVVVKDGLDRYGRVIGRIYLEDGTYVNLKMVRDGYAWWYEKYAKDDSDLQSAQVAAQSDGLGLWQDSDSIAPWAWRRGTR